MQQSCVKCKAHRCNYTDKKATLVTSVNRDQGCTALSGARLLSSLLLGQQAQALGSCQSGCSGLQARLQLGPTKSPNDTLHVCSLTGTLLSGCITEFLPEMWCWCWLATPYWGAAEDVVVPAVTAAKVGLRGAGASNAGGAEEDGSPGAGAPVGTVSSAMATGGIAAGCAVAGSTVIGIQEDPLGLGSAAAEEG